MSVISTTKWLKFFSEAGLPSTVATNYAIIFTNHRIQNNMLSDLTKEILYDMGIKTMGDVIAILRHAKSVDHNTTRDQLFAKEKPNDTQPMSRSTTGSRMTLTLPANSQTGRPLAHRFNAITAPDSTQKPTSTSSVISLKRSAQTSSLKSTNPKIRRVIADDDNPDDDEDIDDLLTKTSVFSRLGNEKNLSKNSSIFSRLGLESNHSQRRVTITGNGINTTLSTKNIIQLNKTKKPIAAPNRPGMRSTQTETLSVRERIGINTISTKLPTNRLVVNRSVGSNRLNPSSSVAQAKRIAMRRAAETRPNKTISLRKNIFDRLGPISL